MPQHIELNQAIDILSSLNATYLRAKEVHQEERADTGWEGLKNIVTLANFAWAHLVFINGNDKERQTVPFAETGFPTLSTLFTDANDALTEYQNHSTTTKRVISEILGDFGRSDGRTLIGKAQARSETLHRANEVMTFLNKTETEDLRNAQLNISVAQGAISKKNMPANYARFFESQGTLVYQSYQAKTKVKPERYSRPNGYKFVASRDSTWKPFFLGFTTRIESLDGTSWWDNGQPLFPKKMIPQTAAQGDPDLNRDKSVFDLLLIQKIPWVDCVKALNTAATSGYNAAIFSIMVQADEHIKHLTDVAINLNKQADRQALEELSHDLARLSERIDKLPEEVRPLVKSAIEKIVSQAVTIVWG